MKVIVHPPTSQKQKDELSKKVAEIYGLAIKFKMEQLNCPKEQKLRLLDEIRLSKERSL